MSLAVVRVAVQMPFRLCGAVQLLASLSSNLLDRLSLWQFQGRVGIRAAFNLVPPVVEAGVAGPHVS